MATTRCTCKLKVLYWIGKAASQSVCLQMGCDTREHLALSFCVSLSEQMSIDKRCKERAHGSIYYTILLSKFCVWETLCLEWKVHPTEYPSSHPPWKALSRAELGLSVLGNKHGSAARWTPCFIYTPTQPVMRANPSCQSRKNMHLSTTCTQPDLQNNVVYYISESVSSQDKAWVGTVGFSLFSFSSSRSRLNK